MSLRTAMRILGAFQPRWRLGAIVGLGILVAGLEALGVYVLYLVGVLLTAGEPTGPVHLFTVVAQYMGVPSLAFLAVLLLPVTLARSAGRLLQERLATRVMLDVIRSSTEQMFEGAFALRYEEFASKSTTERITLMTAEADRAGLAVVSAARLMGSGLMLLLLITLLLVVDWRAFVFGVAGAAVLAAMMQPMLRAAKALGREKGPAGQDLWSTIAEPLRAYKAVVSYHAEAQMKQRLQRSYDRYAAVLWRIGWAQRIVVPTLEVGVAVFIVLGVLVSLTVSASPEEAASTIILLMAGTYRLLPALQQLFLNLGVFRFNLPAYERVQDELAWLRSHAVAQSVRLDSAHGGTILRMRDVGFSYRDGPPILRNVSLEVKPGQKIAIVGESGSGKTTLVDLLLGLLRPTAGTVSLGRRPDGSPSILAYVPQDSIILDATLLENLDLGSTRERIDRARASQVLSQVGLGADSPHPLELDRPLAEGGRRVSGGQRQRIGLARALYRRPDVLLLDEPTSSLDDATEQQVVETLASIPGMAMVIVTHRAAPLRLCDHVYRMHEGRLVQER